MSVRMGWNPFNQDLPSAIIAPLGFRNAER
jgi:hypothetical protein